MSKYTINQYQQVSKEEQERWTREANYFQHTPPNPAAPESSPARKGWGIAKEMKPPVDCVEYVNAVFKRDVAAVTQDSKLRPEFRWSIFSVVMAHFLWFRTEDGFHWLTGLFGVQEVEAFTEGYVYFGNDKQAGAKVVIGPESGLKLKIFQRCDRSLEPAIPSPTDEVLTDMRALLTRARDPNAYEQIPMPAGDMFHWVSEQIRDWLIETKVDRHWPTYKVDRISGVQWVKSAERRPGVKMFEVLDRVEQFGGRAYRVTDVAGNSTWLGSKDDQPRFVRVMTKPDYLRVYQGVSEQTIAEAFRCSSCGKVLPCTPVTQRHKMCCNCMGTIGEKDQRRTLDWCTMRECKHCPNHLESEEDLRNLKSRLNREASFPVRR